MVGKKEDKPKKWRRDELYDLYWTQNLSTYKIAALKGVRAGTVQKMMRSLHVPRREKQRKTDIQDKAWNLFVQGIRQNEIARRLGVSRQRVSELVRERKRKEGL